MKAYVSEELKKELKPMTNRVIERKRKREIKKMSKEMRKYVEKKMRAELKKMKDVKCDVNIIKEGDNNDTNNN